jgi:hypothetical protein
MIERPMLTTARVDRKRLAELLAFMVTCDWAKPQSDSAEDVQTRLLELSNAWHVRAFLAQNDIIQEPPANSRRLRAGSFLDPLADVMSTRLQQMTSAIGGNFRASLMLRMTDDLFARVYSVTERDYSIEIGLRLIVQLFLGAITLSQPGSQLSSTLPNPYEPQHGDGAASVYESQAPLLQALKASAFEFLLPRDGWRRLLAYELFSKAVEFAILHEFGHAIRGHLEFLTKHGMPAERSEDGSQPSAISPLTHQLLEAQADDSASAFLVAKWRHLSREHSFRDGPLMLSRFGFCVVKPEHAQLILTYAVALLFFVIDAEDRGATLIGGTSNPRAPTYPTPAYRSWRFHRWQESVGVAPAPWLTCIKSVRDDLAADRFPHASSIFAEQLVPAQMVAFDQLLIEHSRLDQEGCALLKHEAAYAQMVRPQQPMPITPFWGETKR